MESVLMDPTITATVIGVLLTGVCGAFAFAVRWLRSDIHDLRTDMNGMRSDMKELRSEMRSDIHDLHTEVDKLETKVETKIDALSLKLDGLIMALANSGSLTYPPETTPTPATQPTSPETTPSQSSIGETTGQANCDA